jgi:hypothetical protein
MDIDICVYIYVYVYMCIYMYISKHLEGDIQPSVEKHNNTR